MQPEHRVDLRVLHRAIRDHGLGATRPLFGGLEEELHSARQIVTHLCEYGGHAHEDRDVVVVTARVHDPDLTPLPLCRHLRGERNVGEFGHRKSVHVRT